MSAVHEQRMEKIRRKYKKYRRQYENRRCGELVICCILLMTFIVRLLREADAAGHYIVSGAYGSVVLHSEGGAYVFVGIAAFVAGVAITVICMKYKNRKRTPVEKKEDSQD